MWITRQADFTTQPFSLLWENQADLTEPNFSLLLARLGIQISMIW